MTPLHNSASSTTGFSSHRPSSSSPLRLSATNENAADSSVGAAAATTDEPALACTDEEQQPQSQPSQPSQQQQQQPPFLEPLFALVANTTTGATVHPRVHYLFSDDDASIPTDGALLDGSSSSEHRSLVVDLEPTQTNDDWTVSCASSLGPEFAVTMVELSKQQTDGDGGNNSRGEPDNPSTASASAGSLMLHIEGVSRDAVDLRSSSEAIGSGSQPLAGSSGVGAEDVDGLADEFRRRMGVMKQVVGQGEKRRALFLQQQQQQQQQQHEADALVEDDAYQS